MSVHDSVADLLLRNITQLNFTSRQFQQLFPRARSDSHTRKVSSESFSFGHNFRFMYILEGKIVGENERQV